MVTGSQASRQDTVQNRGRASCTDFQDRSLESGVMTGQIPVGKGLTYCCVVSLTGNLVSSVTRDGSRACQTGRGTLAECSVRIQAGNRDSLVCSSALNLMQFSGRSLDSAPAFPDLRAGIPADCTSSDFPSACLEDSAANSYYPGLGDSQGRTVTCQEVPTSCLADPLDPGSLDVHLG